LNLLSAISLLAEIGDIHLFETSKQLVAYSGLATSIRQSNQTTIAIFSCVNMANWISLEGCKPIL